MEKHIKVARAHRALSWLYGIITFLILVVLLMPNQNTPPLAFVFFMVIFGGLFALHHFTAIGAREKKSWALSSSRGIALFMLIGFPIGTFIGIYLLANSRGGWGGESAIPDAG
jgi:hypothetical protein